MYIYLYIQYMYTYINTALSLSIISWCTQDLSVAKKEEFPFLFKDSPEHVQRMLHSMFGQVLK